MLGSPESNQVELLLTSCYNTLVLDNLESNPNGLSLISCNESCFEWQRRQRDSWPVLCWRFLVGTFGPDVELVHHAGEEDEELHLGKTFSEAATLSNSEGNNVGVRNEASVFVHEPIRIELVRVWERFRIHQHRGQVRQDVGVGRQEVVPDRRRRRRVVEESKRNDVAESLNFKQNGFDVRKLGTQLVDWATLIVGHDVVQLFLSNKMFKSNDHQPCRESFII